MKNYHLRVFTQVNNGSCLQLLEHFKTLTEAERAELEVVPIMNAHGDATNHIDLAMDLSVFGVPTLVVTHESLFCEIGSDGEEYCDQEEQPVERLIGMNNIISHLQATLDAYTYCHPE
ncbi:hypothetical protein ACLM45_01525 [Synechococcus sp. A10-1-5-9]|uniref:hypothetical protein n=1 Tax=Synechococcus sp. A10-1-5-9 TaxID=3392295 RepID=UPI0039E7EEAB